MSHLSRKSLFSAFAILGFALCLQLVIAPTSASAQDYWCEDNCSFVCDRCSGTPWNYSCCVGCACGIAFEGSTYIFYQNPEHGPTERRPEKEYKSSVLGSEDDAAVSSIPATRDEFLNLLRSQPQPPAPSAVEPVEKSD
ncbi:MAG: hypothetical protein AAGD01_13715 [Acidobacteriota bacterium]